MTITTNVILAKRHRSATVAVWAGVILVAALVSAATVFFLAGGRWFIVETPSMGETAPVGTLVLTQPTSVAQLHVGDVISFHPPTVPSQTYTHRIVTITPTGGIATRGDINGAQEGWLLTEKNIVGKVTTILPGIGWLVRGIPYLLIVGAIVLVLTRFIRSRTRRASYHLAGFSLAASFAVFMLKPFTGVVVLASDVSHSGAKATIVSTGLLPIRVSAVGGNSVGLVDGQVGHLSIPSLAHTAHYAVSTSLNLSFWQWAVFVLVCCIPLLYTFIVGLPSEVDDVVLVREPGGLPA